MADAKQATAHRLLCDSHNHSPNNVNIVASGSDISLKTLYTIPVFVKYPARTHGVHPSFLHNLEITQPPTANENTVMSIRIYGYSFGCPKERICVNNGY